jgi:hypothetical protein
MKLWQSNDQAPAELEQTIKEQAETTEEMVAEDELYDQETAGLGFGLGK